MENRAEDEDDSPKKMDDQVISDDMLESDRKSVTTSIQENKKQIHHCKNQIELQTNSLQSLILKTCSNKMKMKSLDPILIGDYVKNASKIQVKLNELRIYIDK